MYVPFYALLIQKGTNKKNFFFFPVYKSKGVVKISPSFDIEISSSITFHDNFIFGKMAIIREQISSWIFNPSSCS